MSRLPVPGGDTGSWGQILNDYLSQTLQSDGTIKDGVVTSTNLSSSVQTSLSKADTAVQPDALDAKLNAPTTPTSGTELVQIGTNGVVSTFARTNFWTWGGAWAASTYYQRNTVVSYTSNGYTRLFLCNTSHTSTSSFDFGLFINLGIQESSADARFFPAPWQASKYYFARQLVMHNPGTGYKLYSAKVTFMSAGSFNANDWDDVTSGGSQTSLVTPNVQTVSYVLVLSDAGKAIEMNSSSDLVLTVPPNSSVAFAIGTVIEVFRRGSGQVTVSPGSGVTIRTSSSSTLRAQYSVATLRLSALNEWVLAGDLT